MSRLVLLILAQFLGLGLGLGVIHDGIVESDYKSQEGGNMKQDDGAKEAEAVGIDGQAAVRKMSLMRRQLPSSGKEPTGHSTLHKMQHSPARHLDTARTSTERGKARVPGGSSFMRSAAVRHGSKDKQENQVEAEGATDFKAAKASCNHQQCERCLACFELFWVDIAELCLPSGEYCLDPDQCYGHVMDSLLDCAGFSDECSDKILCHDPFVFASWKRDNCGGDFTTGQHCNGLLLESNASSKTIGDETESSKSPQLLADNSNEAGSAGPSMWHTPEGSVEVSLFHRQSTNASTINAEGSNLDETLEDKCS